MENRHVFAFGTVDDEVFTHRKSPLTGAQIVIAAAALCAGNGTADKNALLNGDEATDSER